jgi:hypothetical protein
MIVALIYFLTFSFLIFFLVNISQYGLKFNKIYYVFYFIWFFYTFSLPIDLILGFTIKNNSLYPNFNNFENDIIILEMIIHHLFVALGFYIGYKINFNSNSNYKRNDAMKFDSYGWILIVGLNFLILFQYLDATFSLSKADKYLIAKTDSNMFTITLLPTIAQSLSIIYILKNDRRRINNLIFVSLFLLSIFTGDRSNVVILGLIYFSIFNVKFSISKIILALPFVFFYLFFWKAIYHEIIQYLYFNKPIDLFAYTPDGGISSVEFISATNILGYTIVNQPENLLFGLSYFVTPLLLSIPRILFETGVLTLAEKFVIDFLPDLAARGNAVGFSMIAESLLNFGRFGPIMLGVFWGVVGSFLDNRNKDIFFIIGLFAFMKLFRADFATLVKSYIIVFGSISLVCSIFLYFSKMLINDFKKDYILR